MTLRVRKFVVTICVVASMCSCRPTHDKLPHSRDFYAGYIKALNDNFDALFKPERKARSVPPIERQVRGTDGSETTILDEIIDENRLQQATGPNEDTGLALDKELYKRDILGDEVNTKTVGKSEVTPSTVRVFPKTNNDLGVDRVLLTSNITAEDTSDDTFDEENSESSGGETIGKKKAAPSTTTPSISTAKSAMENQRNNVVSKDNLHTSLNHVLTNQISSTTEPIASTEINPTKANTIRSDEEQPDPYKETYPTGINTADASEKDKNSKEINTAETNQRETTSKGNNTSEPHPSENNFSESATSINNMITSNSNETYTTAKPSKPTRLSTLNKTDTTVLSGTATQKSSGLELRKVSPMDNNIVAQVNNNDNAPEQDSDTESSSGEGTTESADEDEERFAQEEQEEEEKREQEEEEEEGETESGEREYVSGDYGSGYHESSGKYGESGSTEPINTATELPTEKTIAIANTPKDSAGGLSRDQPVSIETERASSSSTVAAAVTTKSATTTSESAAKEKSAAKPVRAVTVLSTIRNETKIGTKAPAIAEKAATSSLATKVSASYQVPEISELRLEGTKSEPALTAAVTTASMVVNTDTTTTTVAQTAALVKETTTTGADTGKAGKLVRAASKKTEIEGTTVPTLDFEDSLKEGYGKKKELKQSVKRVDKVVSSEKKTDLEEIAEEKVSSGESEEKGVVVVKRNTTAGEPLKQGEESNYTSDEIEYEDTVTENDDRLLDDKTNKLNKTAKITDEGISGITTAKTTDVKLRSKANRNNHVQKHTIPNTKDGEMAFDAEETDDFDDDPATGDDTTGTYTGVPDGGEVEETDTDLTHTQEEAEATVKKTITAEEDNTDKVANFKEDQDIQDPVTQTVIGANQLKQAVINEDETKEGDDVLATRRTVVPKPMNQMKNWPAKRTNAINPKNKFIQSDINHQVDASKKSDLKETDPHLLDDLPQESELRGNTIKTLEEPLGNPLPLKRDVLGKQDNQFLDAPEYKYKKYMSSTEPIGYRQVDNVNDQSEDASINEGAYIAPVTFFQQANNGRRDEDDELRRHIILDRPENPEVAYYSSPLTEEFPHVLRDAIARNIDQNIANSDDDSDNEEGRAYIVPDSHSYEAVPTHNQATQLLQDVVKWVHPYMLESETSVPASVRSKIANYPRNTTPARHYNALQNTVIKIPLSLIANFIQNGGHWKEVVGSGNGGGKCYFPDCYRSGDNDEEEGVRWYQPHENERAGYVRSVIIPTRHRQEPLVLQPIFVLMPLSVNKA